MSDVLGDWFQILWPSHNIWTLRWKYVEKLSILLGYEFTQATKLAYKKPKIKIVAFKWADIKNPSNLSHICSRLELRRDHRHKRTHGQSWQRRNLIMKY